MKIEQLLEVKTHFCLKNLTPLEFNQNSERFASQADFDKLANLFTQKTFRLEGFFCALKLFDNIMDCKPQGALFRFWRAQFRWWLRSPFAVE